MSSVLTHLRAMPRTAWILFAGSFINRFGSFVMPFLAIYLTRQGFTATRAGLAVSSYGAGHIVASALGGEMADRIGRRHTIALSMFGSAVLLIALAYSRAWLAILALTFLVGAFAELYRPAATALLGDLVTPEQRVTAFGMYRFAVNLGFAAGPAMAGFLADRNFRYLFFGDALTSVAYGVIALLFLPHGFRAPADEEQRESIRVPLRDRALVLLLLGTLCATCVEFQFLATLPLYVQGLGFSATTYGALISLNGAMIVLFELALISLTQRLAARPIIALGYALVGIGYALTGLARTIPMLAATVVIWTIGEMIFAPVAAAYVAGLAPPEYRGRYMGLLHLMWSLGLLIGPTAGTQLYARSPAMLWIACAVLGLLGATLVLWRTRATQTRNVAVASE